MLDLYRSGTTAGQVAEKFGVSLDTTNDCFRESFEDSLAVADEMSGALLDAGRAGPRTGGSPSVVEARSAVIMASSNPAPRPGAGPSASRHGPRTRSTPR